jgi:hypothetical protein
VVRRAPWPTVTCIAAVIVACAATSAPESEADPLDHPIRYSVAALGLASFPENRSLLLARGAAAIWAGRVRGADETLSRGIERLNRQARDTARAASDAPTHIEAGRWLGRPFILSQTFTGLRAVPAPRAVSRHNGAPALV